MTLLKHSGELVTREALIQEIWNNYAGAEEGLTQAISSLRKVLVDDSKSLIQTVPKRGTSWWRKLASSTLVTTPPSKARTKICLWRSHWYRCDHRLSLLLSYNQGDGTVPRFKRGEEKSTEVAFPGYRKSRRYELLQYDHDDRFCREQISPDNDPATGGRNFSSTTPSTRYRGISQG